MVKLVLCLHTKDFYPSLIIRTTEQERSGGELCLAPIFSLLHLAKRAFTKIHICGELCFLSPSYEDVGVACEACKHGVRGRAMRGPRSSPGKTHLLSVRHRTADSQQSPCNRPLVNSWRKLLHLFPSCEHAPRQFIRIHQVENYHRRRWKRNGKWITDVRLLVELMFEKGCRQINSRFLSVQVCCSLKRTIDFSVNQICLEALLICLEALGSWHSPFWNRCE